MRQRSLAAKAGHAADARPLFSIPKQNTNTKKEPKMRGLFLAFEPIANQAGDINSYRIVLINRTLWKIVYDGQMYIGAENLPLGGSVANENVDELGYLIKQQLNDYPTFELTLWRWTTEGQDGRVVKKLKLKPKQFFKKMAYSPYLNADVHLYQLADDFAPPIRREDSLKKYTQENIVEEDNLTVYEKMKVQLFNVKSRAEFSTSIDLHIHKLTADYRKLDASEAFHLQIERFETYLSEAILVGVPHVYIVHGKGKGRLSEEVHKRLRANKDVVRFEDGYHEGFGAGGATKVIF